MQTVLILLKQLMYSVQMIQDMFTLCTNTSNIFTLQLLLWNYLEHSRIFYLQINFLNR